MANSKEGIIAKTEKNELQKNKTLNDYIKMMEPEIKRALPSVMTPERFTRMILTAVRTTPGLAQCTPQSFLAAMMTAAQLGLEPNTPLGQAYLLPFNNRKTGKVDAQFQLGYKGLIDLAYRSGDVALIDAHCVYENDEFECEFGLEPKLKHIPAATDRGELVKVYAMFKTKSGGYGFNVMSVEDVREHAKKYSKAYNSSYSPWKTSFEEMAKKTVLKQVLKYAPMKSDFVRGMSADNTVKSSIDEDMYNVPADNAEYVDITAYNSEDETDVQEAPGDI